MPIALQRHHPADEDMSANTLATDGLISSRGFKVEGIPLTLLYHTLLYHTMYQTKINYCDLVLDSTSKLWSRLRRQGRLRLVSPYSLVTEGKTLSNSTQFKTVQRRGVATIVFPAMGG